MNQCMKSRKDLQDLAIGVYVRQDKEESRTSSSSVLEATWERGEKVILLVVGIFESQTSPSHPA